MTKYGVMLNGKGVILDTDKAALKMGPVQKDTRKPRDPDVVMTVSVAGASPLYSGDGWPQANISAEDLIEIENRIAAAKAALVRDPRPLEQMVAEYLTQRREREAAADREYADFERFAEYLRKIKVGEFTTIMLALKMWTQDSSEENTVRLKRLGEQYLDSEMRRG